MPSKLDALLEKPPLKFSELELRAPLAAAIEKLGFQECTPVQTATIPHVIEGRDVAGLAQTGTGKTAAFLLPLMERILCSRTNAEQATEAEKESAAKRAFPDWKPTQFVLVLVPTRELAEQVYENAVSLAGDSGLRAVSIYGGVAYDKQKAGLRDGFEFVIATPGRLIDLYKEHLCDLKQVRAIVFDEADRMFDMGFKDDMKFILQRVPKERQFLVFSATLNMDVMSTAYQFGANPIDVDVSRDQAKAENVDDKIFHVGQDDKGMYLLSLIKAHKPRQAIIFSNFKMNVPRISQFLNDNGVPTVGISSLLTQTQRTRVMEQFKSDASDRNILVATDVAARGLDIKGVDMVVNFELPDDAENYVHRIGRTGRAGAKGIAFSLVSDRDVDALGRVEEYLRHKVEPGWIEDTDLIRDFVAMPSDRGPRRSFGDSPGRSGSGGGPRRPPERRDGPGGPDSRSGSGSGPRSGPPQRSAGGAQRNDRGPLAARSESGSDSGRNGGRPDQNRSRGGSPGREGSQDGRRDARGSGSGPQRSRGGAPLRDGPRPDGQRSAQGGRDGGVVNSRAGNSRSGGPQDRPNQNGRPGGPPSRQGQTAHRNGGRPGPNAPRQNAGGSRGGRPNPGRSGQAPPTIGKKVSGFFKKLFGGSKTP